MDLILPIPIDGCDQPFETNTSLDINESRLRNLPKHQRTETLTFARPIHVGMLVRNRSKHIQRAHPARSKLSSKRTAMNYPIQVVVRENRTHGACASGLGEAVWSGGA